MYEEKHKSQFYKIIFKLTPKLYIFKASYSALPQLKKYFKFKEVNELRGTYWYLQNSHMEGRQV